MFTLRRLASVASLAAFLALGATASHAAFASTDTAPDAAAGPEHRGHHGHGDLLHASLRLDSLTAAQRQQLEALAQAERTAHANVETARGQLLQTLASRVAAGNVDDVAIAPQMQALESAIQADEPGDRATLEKVHAVLTPAQRAEVASKIEERESHAWGHMRDGAKAAPDAAPPEHEHMGAWGHLLNLSDAQREQIKTNLRSIGPAADKTVWREAHETRQRVLEAFKGSRFVMNEVAPPRDPRVVDEGVEHMVRLAKASAPVLTSEQRAVVSAKLQKMATRATATK